MYGISTNATDIRNLVQENYRVIDFNWGQCNTACDRQFEADSTSTALNLQACLAGQDGPPTSSSTTTTTTEKSPIETTTPEPEYPEKPEDNDKP